MVRSMSGKMEGTPTTTGAKRTRPFASGSATASQNVPRVVPRQVVGHLRKGKREIVGKSKY